MIALLQRVRGARVDIGGATRARIGPGILALIGVQREDTESQARRLAERITGYRLFADGQGRMNLSVVDTGGQVLLVPQFTLAADTQKGMRPGFARAAGPEAGARLFECLAAEIRARNVAVETGEFGADMQVELVNDGPVTFWLEAPSPAAG